jgi:hypothetical protein
VASLEMFWIKRHFTHTNMWANTYLMACAEKLLVRFPREFMMVEERRHSLDATIWVRLPDASLRAMFPEFIEANIGDLTVRPTKLAAEDVEFERVFGGLSSRR